MNATSNILVNDILILILDEICDVETFLFFSLVNKFFNVFIKKIFIKKLQHYSKIYENIFNLKINFYYVNKMYTMKKYNQKNNNHDISKHYNSDNILKCYNNYNISNCHNSSDILKYNTSYNIKLINYPRIEFDIENGMPTQNKDHVKVIINRIYNKYIDPITPNNKIFSYNFKYYINNYIYMITTMRSRIVYNEILKESNFCDCKECNISNHLKKND